MVRGSVVAGDAGTVEAEHDGQAVQADVVGDLVDGSREERGVDGEDRAQPTHGHPGRRGDRVLLGDADVDEPAGEALAEGEEAGGVGHGGRDGDQLRSGLGLLDHRLGEGGGVRAGLRLADVVEALDRIVLRGRVAAALLRDDVHDDRTVELGRVAQRLLHALDVVAVERAGVADTERLEEGRRLEHLAHRGDEAVEAALELVPDHGQLVQELVEASTVAQVVGVHPEPGQALAQLGDGGGIGPAVVVQDEDGLLARVAQVVQALERHAAGEGAVAHHRHDPALVAAARAPGRRRDRGRS